MPDPVAAASRFAGFPAWVLLDPFATFGEHRNHTTAYSRTSANRPVEVSFELVDPLKVSRWFVHRTSRKKDRGFHGRPDILSSSGSFVVLRMSFYRQDERIFDYFVYKAGGSGKPPSLDLIPGPCPTVDCRELIGILPNDDGSEHYFVEIKFHYSGCCHRDAGAVPIGWTATVWKRRCSSMEPSWDTCFEVDIAKILRGRSLQLNRNSSSSDLLQKVWDTKSNKLDLNMVSSAPPLLSLTNGDVVYFMMNLFSNEALGIAVNARKKKLEAVEQTPFESPCSPCSFSSRLLDASSGTDDTVNQSDECDDRDNVDCLVTHLQAALDELKDIEEHLEPRKPWYNGIEPLRSDGLSSSSLHDVIEAVAPNFSVNAHNNSTPDAVDLLVECFRELGDLKSRILAPVEEMKNKVSLALVALDTLQNGHMSYDGRGADVEQHGFK